MKQIIITLYTNADDDLAFIENDLLNALKSSEYTFDVGEIKFSSLEDLLGEV